MENNCGYQLFESDSEEEEEEVAEKKEEEEPTKKKSAFQVRARNPPSTTTFDKLKDFSLSVKSEQSLVYVYIISQDVYLISLIS